MDIWGLALIVTAIFLSVILVIKELVYKLEFYFESEFYLLSSMVVMGIELAHLAGGDRSTLFWMLLFWLFVIMLGRWVGEIGKPAISRPYASKKPMVGMLALYLFFMATFVSMVYGLARYKSPLYYLL